MAAKPEAPTEPFKRALAHAARSLAEMPDLEIVYSGEGPSLVGNRATLPHPPRDLNSREATRIRGLADRMALRLAHHDSAAHARLVPSNSEGAALFEAVEQARIEAIGANALGGVRDNLRAVLETQIERKGLARVEDRTQVPLADVVGLLVRERLTGEPPPPAAKALVDGMRAEIEEKAGKDLDRLVEAYHDQAAFGRVARDIISDLGVADEGPPERADELSDEEPEGEDQPEDGEDSEGDDSQAPDFGLRGADPDLRQRHPDPGRRQRRYSGRPGPGYGRGRAPA